MLPGGAVVTGGIAGGVVPEAGGLALELESLGG